MSSKSKMMGAMALTLIVFPGTGHVLLGRYRQGLVWSIVFAVVFICSLGLAGAEASKVMDSMMSPNGDVNFDLSQLMKAGVFSLVSTVIWGLAALDTYRVARKLEVTSATQPETDAPA